MRKLLMMLAGLAAVVAAAGPLDELAGRVAPGLEGGCASGWIRN